MEASAPLNGATDPAAPAEPAPTDAGDWRSGLDPNLARVASRFSSPADVVKSYAELRRKMSGVITPPAPDAPPEAQGAFWRQLGRPETPTQYAFAPAPEAADYNPELEDWFRDTAFSLNMPGSMAAGLHSAFVGLTGELAARQNAQDHARLAQAEARLKREWGRDYDANLAHARRAFGAFLSDNGEPAAELKLADGTPLGNHPMIVRAFAAIGRRMGEDGVHDGAGGLAGEGLQQELKGLMARRDYWSNREVQARVREIHVQLYGTDPVG